MAGSATRRLAVRVGGRRKPEEPGPVMTTSLADMDALRGAAVAAITEVWGVLAAEHVVPCSRYRPYIQVGRDYQGGLLSGCLAVTQFSETLRQMYPVWFGAPSDDSARWFPDHLAFDFVEATIAELTRRGETGDTPNGAVEVTLLHLIDYLDTEDSRLACARRVSHLMTADRKELTIAGVTILDTGSSRRPGISLRSSPRRIRRTTANGRSRSPGPKLPWSATRPGPIRSPSCETPGVTLTASCSRSACCTERRPQISTG